jgi:RND family efflux transporter MFP subunit
VALGLARGQAAAQLVSAQAALAALQSGLAQDAAVEAARLARDQAHAAYLGAVAQRDALARASSVGAALDAADAAITAAGAARELAASALEDATMVAPADGVIVFNSVSGLIPGGPVVKPAPGSSVSPAAAPFAIVVFDELLFTAQVDEADITRVEAGMTARVSLDGIPDEVFETEVLQVEPQSVLTVTGGTAFPVTMRITNRDDAVLIGMNGSVEIEVEMVADVVTIPIEALLEDAEGSYVYEVVDGELTKTRIEAGRLTDTRASVTSGLAEGALVVTSDVTGIAEGARVRTR